MAPRVRLVAVEAHERPFALRLPFRFGLHTLTAATQAVVTATVETDAGTAVGHAAEVLLPKWFDKRPHLAPADNEAQLRASLRRAVEAYVAAGRLTAFGLFAETHRELVAAAAAVDDPALVADYGPALLDRAVLDALCRQQGCSFAEALRLNLPGLVPHAIAPDLAGADLRALLEMLRPLGSLHARHTVGLLDPLGDREGVEDGGDREDRDPDDGLPTTLPEVVRFYGCTHYKLKLSGDVGHDLARLRAIARVLDALPAYRVTLDGNEQYADLEPLLELWTRAEADPALARLVAATLLIEQPLSRDLALAVDVEPLSRRKPVIVDESDGPLDTFVTARARGYRGISSKSCKGLYRSVINAARCDAWNRRGEARHVLSAEDLVIQPGLSMQQDLALVATLGIGHVERNGHHYVRGLATCGDPEAAAYVQAHADLYTADPFARLRIEGGRLSTASTLAAPGLGTALRPDTRHDRAMAGLG